MGPILGSYWLKYVALQRAAGTDGSGHNGGGTTSNHGSPLNDLFFPASPLSAAEQEHLAGTGTGTGKDVGSGFFQQAATSISTRQVLLFQACIALVQCVIWHQFSLHGRKLKGIQDQLRYQQGDGIFCGFFCEGSSRPIAVSAGGWYFLSVWSFFFFLFLEKKKNLKKKKTPGHAGGPRDLVGGVIEGRELQTLTDFDQEESAIVVAGTERDLGAESKKMEGAE